MASPIEVMDVSDAAAGGDGGFTEVVNPKKRLRENSEPGSPRGERQSEATVTIKPVLSKQSVAKLNGLAVAREINRIAGGSVARVQKRSNLIIVTAHNSKQAMTMANETKFCGVEVTITMGRPVGSAKGVIMGIPHELEDEEILAALSNQGITAAKRIQKKVGGQLQKTTAIQLTFKTKMPEIINFGYEKKKVRPYVPPVIRCFKCQQYGHGSDKCRGRVHCAACGEGHEWKECPNKSSPKCARCGGAHSAAYMGCVAYKEAKKYKHTNLKKKCLIARHLKPLKNKSNKKSLQKKWNQTRPLKRPKPLIARHLKPVKNKNNKKSLQKKWNQTRPLKRPKPQLTPQNQRVRRKRHNKRLGSQKGLHKRPTIHKRLQSNRKRRPHSQKGLHKRPVFQKRRQSNRKRRPHPQNLQPKLASVKQTLLSLLIQLSTPISFLP